MFLSLPIRKCWCNSSITCFLVLLRFSRIKNVICKNDEGGISVCKASCICVVGERKYKKWRFFVEEKKENNFVLGLVAYVWEK